MMINIISIVVIASMHACSEMPLADEGVVNEALDCLHGLLWQRHLAVLAAEAVKPRKRGAALPAPPALGWGLG
eukprot:3828629-Karenia_brevis.AAC.1